MNKIKSTLTALALCAGFAFTASGQIITFTTTGLSSGSNNPSSINPDFTAANLTTGSLTKGSGLTTGSGGGNLFYGSTWGAGSVPGTLQDSIDNDRFFTFSITPTAGYLVSLSSLDYRIYRTQAGANNWVWQFSIDSGAYTTIGSPLQSLATSTTTAAQPQINLSLITELQDVSETINFRLIAWSTDLTSAGGGSPTGGGNLGFGSSGTNNANSDAIVFGGTVSAVPEPSTYAAIVGLLALGLVLVRRRMRS